MVDSQQSKLIGGQLNGNSTVDRDGLLRQMQYDFNDALCRTSWAKTEWMHRLISDAKRYRVVRIIHKRGSLQIAAIYINVGPFSFAEAQKMVDWFTDAYHNGELYRSRNYMQEIRP